jgi:2-keto-4-pentenoate hydratase/2-oxohepta-3-ene-1,7-dioic acid hydratase in catechol pathway
MRTANVDGRLKLLVDDGAVDVATASEGRFGPEPARCFEQFGELRRWAADVGAPLESFDAAAAGPPSPAPRQTFGIGLNYVDHARESGLELPTAPLVFPKFVSSLTGASANVQLPRGSVDWEVEIVVVIGEVARAVEKARAWDVVAGLSVGQDLSERELQWSGPAPQFGLSKSFPGFSPMGPCLVTPDEFRDPNVLELGCELNGEVVQRGRSTDMVFGVPELIAYLSGIVTLLPGDVIYTGTPAGVGAGRKPPRFLQPGDILRSWVEGIGAITQTFVAAP